MGRKKSTGPKLSWRMKQFMKYPAASRIRSNRISQEEKLTEDFIRQYADYLNWNKISQYQQISEDFCLEFYNRINWMTVLNRGLISETFLRTHSDMIKWENVSRSQMNFSIEFCREFVDKIDWRGFGYSHYNISMSFIEEFRDKVEWTNLLYRTKLDENFVRRHLTDLNRTYSFWHDVGSHVTLSEKFIREYADKLDWRNLSSYQTLSEEMIHDFKDKVSWDYIVSKQTLSEKFVKEHIDLISQALNSTWRWRDMLKQQKLGKRFMRKIADKIDWWEIKRDLDYIKKYGGQKYNSKVDDKFVNRMIELERKKEEKRKLDLKKLNYTW